MLNNTTYRLPIFLALVIGIFPAFAFALDAPNGLRGTEIRQNTVKWEWAATPGARNYEVTVNWKVVDVVSRTSFESYNLFAGNHYMSVRAIAANGTRSAPSPTAKITTNRVFNSGNHGRSYLISGQPASTGGFRAPDGLWGKESSANTGQWGWNKVSGAVSYDVFVDGIYRGSTGESVFYTSGLSKGVHSMHVKAVSADRKISGNSGTIRLEIKGNGSSSGSTTASGNIAAPRNTRGVEYEPRKVRWQWDAVSGATKYEVYVDGKWVGHTGSTQWVSSGLWIGEHSMAVKAINGSGRVSSLSATAKLNVRGSGSQAATSPPPPPQEQSGGDPNAANVRSMVDPESYNKPEASKSGWELTFSDEFGGTSLNPHRWHTQLRWDGEWNGERYEYRIINGESQFYVNTLGPDAEHKQRIVPLHNPFKFNGSRLAIQAIRNPLKDRNHDRNFGRLLDVARQQPFLSGAISTHEKFSQKYGYFEARIKIPDHVGTFPAFWLFHERRAWEGTQRTEIDIMENLGHAPWYVYNSFHYFKNVSTTYGGDANFVKPSPSGQIYTGTDYSDNYHVYAVEWSPGRVRWFIDGQQVSELYNGEVDFEELYVMINLAIGGNWTNFPKNAGGLGRPADQRWPTNDDINQFRNPMLEIDYVRVYKRR
jgi:hypothetical protein